MSNIYNSYHNSYLSVEYNNKTIIISNEFTITTYNYDDIQMQHIIIISPILYSSDSDVRIMGMKYPFYEEKTNIFIAELSLTTEGLKLINTLLDYINREEIIFKLYEDPKFNRDLANGIYYKKMMNTTTDKEIMQTKKYKIFRYTADNLNQGGQVYIKFLATILIFYYSFIKYQYLKDMSNSIDSEDVNFIKYLDSILNLSDSEIEVITKLFHSTIYKYYDGLLDKYVQKITLSKHKVEWEFNKLLNTINYYNKNESQIRLVLPNYDYFAYKFNTEEFIESNKLLIRLKFKNEPTLITNLYIGQYVGKTIYKNIMDIKNNSPQAKNITGIELDNLFKMNMLNLRFMHLFGITHNDLHLNNIVFNVEPDFMVLKGMVVIQTYELNVMNKFYLKLGKIDYNIIDFGRSLYIDDQDNILRNIQRWDIGFYEKNIHAMNKMFNKDLLMTGYILTLFDYIEYIKNIIIGFKYINNTEINYDKLTNIINYIYDIMDAYFNKTKKHKKILDKLTKMLEYDHYKKMPQLIQSFDSNIDIEKLINDMTSKNNAHPIDLVFEKFYPELFPENSEITEEQFNKLSVLQAVQYYS